MGNLTTITTTTTTTAAANMKMQIIYLFRVVPNMFRPNFPSGEKSYAGKTDNAVFVIHIYTLIYM
jgi:hypothetical protein